MGDGQERWDIFPGVGMVDARINPVTGFHDVTFTDAAWTNLLSIIGYARACAALSREGLMEQGADELMAALRRAERQESEGHHVQKGAEA